MCQILGMNCAAPTDFCFSLRGFCCRGGRTDKHSHGFGISIYEGAKGGLRSFHDTKPAAESPIAELVQRYGIRTLNMMAHIRYATQGCVSLENVHPFSREMWGVQWTFCHNGDVPKFSSACGATNIPCLGKTQVHIHHPVGDTDSEAVFCAILNALYAEFTSLPSTRTLHDALERLCQEIVRNSEETVIFNCLLGCGPKTLFAYSWPGRRPTSTVWNGLYYLVREPPFSTARLVDVDYTVDFATVTTPKDRVAVITTKPLTTEPGWKEFQKGQLIMFHSGKPYFTSNDCEQVQLLTAGVDKMAVAAATAEAIMAASNAPTTAPAS